MFTLILIFVFFFVRNKLKICKNLGRQACFDNSRMTEILEIKPTPVNESICDMAYSMIEMSVIPKRF